MKKFTLLLSAMLLACATNQWAEEVTYTVASTSSVTTTDTVPEGSSATFKNTYTNAKEQLTNSNSMTLTLKGYAGYVIKGITLRMKSNKSAGAGTFSAKAGTTTLAEISTATAFNAWFDNTAYTTTYKDVHVTMSNSAYAIQESEDVVIVITATTNSLYCQSFTITYELSSTPVSTLTALTITGTPDKTNYEEGDTFDPTGLVVTGEYDDNSTKNITEGITWETDPDPLKAGTTAVDVKASVKNAAEVVVISNTYTVTGLTVTASLTSIAVSGTPAKINYKEGDTFDPTGLIVTGTYSDKSTKPITEGITWTITPKVLTEGTTFVTVEATLNGVTSDPFKVENIVVTAPQPGDEVTVTFEAGVDKASSGVKTITKNEITLTATTFDNTSYYQTFKNETFKATSTQGKIKSIVFTCTVNGTAKYGPGNYSVPEDGVGTYTFEAEGLTGTWTGSAAEVVLLAKTNQVRMTKVVVTYVVADPDAPNAPVISGETPFHGSTDVSITAGENLKIYYTTNGDEPTTASTLYTAPFAITATTTVKAIAVNETTSSVSIVAEKTFTHQDAVTLSAIDYTTNGTKVFLQAVTVVYANDAYTYLKDETGVGLLYGGNLNLTAGDMVAGLAATTTVYKELPELVPTVTLEDLTVTSGVAPSPAEAKAVPTAEEVNTYLLLKGVTLAADAATISGTKLQNVTVTFKGGSIELRDQFGVVTDGTIKAGTYDVEGFVSVYNTTVQFYITKITSTATAIDNAAVEAPAIKTIENGQLVIIRDGVKYNAMGVRL